MIDIENAIVGNIYKINSRNLDFAVYAGENKFIGIREKFDSRYLDTEYYNHTVRAILEDLGPIKDSHIIITETLHSVCFYCKKEVFFDKTWKHLNETTCTASRGTSVNNSALFEYLDDNYYY